MTLVLATAVSVWVIMLLLDTFNPGNWGFIVDSTVAVIGGAIIGFIAAWYLRRQRRKG